MSKDLEFLADLHSHAHYEQTDIESKKVILSAYAYLKKRLTPPTEQEVCEALSDWLECKVNYKAKNKTFYFRQSTYNVELVSYYKDEKGYVIHFEFGEPLPPHLITRICRFYEGKARE